MARCSCGSSACSCTVVGLPDSGITVVGQGNPGRPYEISLTDPGPPSMRDLSDVIHTDVPVTNDVPVWNGTAWEFKTAPPPVSGIWGTAPLDTTRFPETDRSLGQPIYLDALGKLRTQPLVIAPTSDGTPLKTAASLPGTYPLGLSVLGISALDAVAGSWPGGHTAVVLTMCRAEADLAANNTASQWWCRNTGVSGNQDVQYRSGTDALGWTPWKRIVGPYNPVIARGRAQITVSAAVLGTVAVTFPAGLFAAAPRVMGTNIGSSVWMIYSSNAPTASGFTLGARHVDNTSSSGTVNVDWIAVEVE